MEPEATVVSMDRAAEHRLMLALTTEQFTLQTARSATISECRAGGAPPVQVSSRFVALAFAGQP